METKVVDYNLLQQKMIKSYAERGMKALQPTNTGDIFGVFMENFIHLTDQSGEKNGSFIYL